MILQVPPDAPLVLKVGADAILLSHIGGAAAGIISGFIAIFARKGGRPAITSNARHPNE